jgi:ubiquinone/menaquinone biosynthesis C-methylase UbiE
LIKPSDRQAPVTDYFEKDAAFWDELYRRDDVFSVIHRERTARAIAEVGRLPFIAGSRVLEVGCGAGLMAIAMATRGSLVEATDSTPAMVELTRRNAAQAGLASRLTASIADAHNLAYPDAMFDVVVALGVLPWLHSPTVGLKEMTRVLRPGGYLVANTDNRARLTHLVDPLFNPLLQPVRRRLGHGRQDGASTTTTWSRSFDRELRAAGLVKRRSFTLGFGPFTFLGRQVVRGGSAVAVHSTLQKMADRQVPLIRSTGSQYMFVVQKSR